MHTPTQSIDALTARTQFGSIMGKAGKGKTRFLVSRRGKPTVVILGVSDYMENFLKKPAILVEIQKYAALAGLNTMADKESNGGMKAAGKVRQIK